MKKFFAITVLLFSASLVNHVYAEAKTFSSKGMLKLNMETRYTIEQDTTRANLEEKLTRTTVDTTRARVMFDLGVHLWEIDFSESERYFNSAITTLLGSTTKNSSLLGDSYRYLAALLTDKGRYTEAMVYYNKAKEQLEISENPKGISNIYHNMAVLHRYQENPEEQKRNLKAAIAIDEQLDYAEGLGHNYKALGNYFSKRGVVDSAMFYFKKSEDNFNRIHDEFGLYSLKGIVADFYFEQGEYQKSLEIFKECLDFFTRIDVKGFQAIHTLKIASIYMLMGDYKKALTYNENSLNIALQEDYKQWISEGYLQKSKLYEHFKNYETAYESAKLHKLYSDSIFNKENVKKIQALELTFNFRKEKLKDSLTLVGERKFAEAQVEVLATKNRVKTFWIVFGGLGLLFLFAIIYLLKTKQFASQSKELQEQFSRDLINEQERERTHLARELHDSVGQKLMLLSKQTKKIGDENTQELADTTLEEIRNISRGLHPSNLERLGLTASINSLIYNINANTDLFFTESIENVDNTLKKESELHLYRILQETLSNIVKHAKAKAVEIEVSKGPKHIDVLVSDNGMGFDVTSKNKTVSLGIKTLFERAKILGAQLKLNSEINNGTVMSLKIPLSYE
ncbi:MAG: sensor histidine kinase [Aureisphaera sp.]